MTYHGRNKFLTGWRTWAGGWLLAKHFEARSILDSRKRLMLRVASQPGPAPGAAKTCSGPALWNDLDRLSHQPVLRRTFHVAQASVSKHLLLLSQNALCIGGLAGIALAKAGHEATACLCTAWRQERKNNLHLPPGRPLRLADECALFRFP